MKASNEPKDNLESILVLMASVVLGGILATALTMLVAYANATEEVGEDIEEVKRVLVTYSCTGEDNKKRAEFERECMGEEERLGDMCRRYSAERFCEVSYDY